MRAAEFLTENYNKNKPSICVDVQPAYSNAYDYGLEDRICNFNVNQHAPTLMLVNAEQDGLTEDTLSSIYTYWHEICERNGYDFESDFMPNVEFYDKGYGYLRGAMDQLDEEIIIKVIREMDRQNVQDSRSLFDGDYDDFVEFLDGDEYAVDVLLSDAISIGWITEDLLRRYAGYLYGGSLYECLAEVRLLMDAYNIPYEILMNMIY